MAKSFISELSYGDFKKLAEATRRAALPRVLTDQQIVEFIERLGPVVAESLIKAKLHLKKQYGDGFDDGLIIK